VTKVFEKKLELGLQEKFLLTAETRTVVQSVVSRSVRLFLIGEGTFDTVRCDM